MTDIEPKASNQKPKKDVIAVAIDNNPCGRCRAMGSPVCKCGGGGSSNGESGGSYGNDDIKNKNVMSLNQASSTLGQIDTAAIKKFDEAKTVWLQSLLSSDSIINYKAGLFSIENDRLRGNFTFHVGSRLSKDEIEISRELLKAVKIEFDEFKLLLTESGISTQRFSAKLEANELIAHIPNPKYYNSFIKHLESKNLLPIPNPERVEKNESYRSAKEDKQKIFSPNPYSTRLERK